MDTRVTASHGVKAKLHTHLKQKKLLMQNNYQQLDFSNTVNLNWALDQQNENDFLCDIRFFSFDLPSLTGLSADLIGHS